MSRKQNKKKTATAEEVQKEKKKRGRHPQMIDSEAGNPKASYTHVTVGKAEQDGGKKNSKAQKLLKKKRGR